MSCWTKQSHRNPPNNPNYFQDNKLFSVNCQQIPIAEDNILTTQ